MEKDNRFNKALFQEMAKKLVSRVEEHEGFRLTDKGVTVNFVYLHKGDLEPAHTTKLIKDSLERDKKHNKFFFFLSSKEEDLKNEQIIMRSLSAKAGFIGIGENDEIQLNPKGMLLSCMIIGSPGERIVVIASANLYIRQNQSK